MAHSYRALPDAKGLPAYVEREFYDYLQCGILAHGFLRLGCDTCQKELLLPLPTSQTWSRRSAGGSSASYAT